MLLVDFLLKEYVWLIEYVLLSKRFNLFFIEPKPYTYMYLNLHMDTKYGLMGKEKFYLPAVFPFPHFAVHVQWKHIVQCNAASQHPHWLHILLKRTGHSRNSLTVFPLIMFQGP